MRQHAVRKITIIVTQAPVDGAMGAPVLIVKFHLLPTIMQIKRQGIIGWTRNKYFGLKKGTALGDYKAPPLLLPLFSVRFAVGGGIYMGQSACRIQMEILIVPVMLIFNILNRYSGII